MRHIFYLTLKISIIIQIITGILEIITALFIKTPPQYHIISELLYLEVTVQLIEASFYLWLVFNFNKVTNVTPKRYIDWGITTPTMLVTLIVYLIYLDYRSKNMDTSSLSLIGVLKDNFQPVAQILSLNWLMLLLT